MRILLVAGKMQSGGAETHVYELALSLCRMGNTVTLASSGGLYADRLETEGVEQVRLPLHSKSPISMLKSYVGLSAAIRKGDFDVVHAHTRIAAFIASQICKKNNIPMVTTAHAKFRSGFFLDKFSRWGDKTVAVSQDIAQHLICRSVAAENVTVIPNGINTDTYTHSYVYGSKTVTFLSRLDGDCSDAAYALCRIAKNLVDTFGAISIRIGGGGDELQGLRALAEEVNGSLDVRVIEVIGQVEDVAQFLAGSEVFVGVSRAALEAMACGIPTVLAGNEGFMGAVDEEKLTAAQMTNFCCRGKEKIDDERLFDEVARLISMPRERAGVLSELLREYVVNSHSATDMVQRTAAVYSSVESQSQKREGEILFCGYYGFGNMGDDAMLRAAIRRAKDEYPSLAVSALTRGGRRDKQIFGIRCVKRSSLISVLREIKRAKIVVFGGGTLLQNSTSKRSLFYYAFLLIYANKKGCRTQLWANGIGIINGYFSRRVVSKALVCCELLGFRDKESLDEAIELLKDFGRSIPQTVLEKDLAAEVLPCDGERLLYLMEHLGISEGDKIAVIAAKGSEKKGYRRMLEKQISLLVSKSITPVFIPMYPSEDLEVCIRICRDRGGVVAHPICVSDAVALIRRSEIVLSMRYHALVFANAVGTPFVAFGSQPKVSRFCKENSLGMTDCTELL